MKSVLEDAKDGINYLLEDNRRKTFKKWVFNDKSKCNADKMAEAGFIFIGNSSERDATKCFFCNKSLDGWEATDDPWKEHLKHSPKCSFAKLQKAQEHMKLKEFLVLKDELMEKIINSFFDEKVKSIEEEFSEYEETLTSLMKRNNC